MNPVDQLPVRVVILPPRRPLVAERLLWWAEGAVCGAVAVLALLHWVVGVL